ncbi:hypothetical protein [Thermaurantiacus sp.]
MPNCRVALLLALVLVACQRNPLEVRRSPCPAAAIPHHVGQLTRFNPPESRDADAIDFVAQIVDLATTCAPAGETVGSEVRFAVTALRRPARDGSLPARTVDLPVFVSLVQGGNVLVAKKLTAVRLEFAEGARRASGAGGARADVARAATTPPPEVLERITRQRKATDPDALVDPMSDPVVRAAIRAATFEVLVGFQLDDASLAYNLAK